MKEYQQAARMSALLCFISDLEKRQNLCRYFVRCKIFILYSKKEECLYIMFRLRYLTIECNANEYKMMGQGSSLGQFYNVHNGIKITKKALVGLTHLLRQVFPASSK